MLFLEVIPGSPADKAGLQPTRRAPDGRISIGDIIVAIDGKAVSSFEDLNRTLGNYKIGQGVKLTILRNRESVDLQVDLTTPTQAE